MHIFIGQPICMHEAPADIAFDVLEMYTFYIR